VLRKIERPPVLIFADSKHTVDQLVQLLKIEQFHVAGLHSDKSQPFRFRVMRAFKSDQLDVLVATDVASRGLDIDQIQHVILYDMPPTIEDYIHRVGRAARGGRPGAATSLMTYECKIGKELLALLKETKQAVPRELEDNVRLFGRAIISTELGDRVVM
jgi:ATP-dependent RNA helicase DDX41